MPSTRFTAASHRATVGSSVPCAPALSNANARTPKSAASANVVTGPAIATRNSSRASRASVPSLDTPPSIQRVMPSTV